LAPDGRGGSVTWTTPITTVFGLERQFFRANIILDPRGSLNSWTDSSHLLLQKTPPPDPAPNTTVARTDYRGPARGWRNAEAAPGASAVAGRGAWPRCSCLRHSTECAQRAGS